MDWGFFARFVFYSSLIWLTAISKVNEWKWQGAGNSYGLFLFFFSIGSLTTAGAAHFLAGRQRGSPVAQRVEFYLPGILAIMVLLQNNTPSRIALLVFVAIALVLGAAKKIRRLDLDAELLVLKILPAEEIYDAVEAVV